MDYETRAFYELTIRVDDLSPRNNFSIYCSARINVVDVNDNPAKLKVIKFLNESVQMGFYSLHSLRDSSSELAREQQFDKHDSNLGYQIEITENNSPYTILALIRVFDQDSLSNYRFLIQSATNSHEDTTMFQVRSSDKANREFELITTTSFNAELIQSYRLKVILYDLDVDADLDTEFSQALMLKKRLFDKSFDYHGKNFEVKTIQKHNFL